MKRRIAVTGLGVLCPIGNNLSQFEAGLIAGKNGISKNRNQDTTDYISHLLGQIKGFSLAPELREQYGHTLSKVEEYSLTACLEAWNQAALKPNDKELQRIGVVLGSGGSIEGIERFIDNSIREEAALPSKLLNVNPDVAGTFIANHLKLGGPKSSIMTACSSGATAVGFAADFIRNGYADVMIAGGVESLSTVTLSGFNSLGALSSGDIKPFSGDRDGIILGDGAGILILESYDHAIARGAQILTEFCAYGFTADGYHMTAPHPQGAGLVKAMRQAVDDAGIRFEDIQYVNAHGTGTELNDKSETAALHHAFGEYANKLCVSSTKSMIGHTLSAAGAIESIATCLALMGQFVPPTINYTLRDENCDLDYVPNKSRSLAMDYAMTNSLAFGGNNTSVIFKRVQNQGGEI